MDLKAAMYFYLKKNLLKTAWLSLSLHSHKADGDYFYDSRASAWFKESANDNFLLLKAQAAPRAKHKAFFVERILNLAI